MTVRLAFIGAGGIASRHLNHIENHTGSEVVAICDIAEDVAVAAAEPHDAEVYLDHHDLYTDADFDASVVAVPPFAHEDQERLAAEYGVDLFVEKPLGLDSKTVRRNEMAIEDSDILTQVGHMGRYADAVQRAKELIEGRTLALVDGHWWTGVVGNPDHWWRSRDRSGGQVIEQATHTYDLVRYLAGDIETVHAVGSRCVNPEAIDFEDTTSASMRHENGTTSHISATSASPQGDRRIQLIGDGFTLEIDVPSDHLRGTIDGEEVDFQGSGEMFATEMDAFIEASETGNESLLRSPYSDARKTFETTLAVDRSLGTGEAEEVMG